MVNLARLQPPSAQDHGIQVHLQIHLIAASQCISEFSRSSISGTPRIALKHRLHRVQMYGGLLGHYIDQQNIKWFGSHNSMTQIF